MSAFLFIMFLLLACGIVAAWPLLALARVRATMLGAAGGSCVMLGGALFFTAITSLPGIANPALAEDSKPIEAPKASTEPTPEEASASETPSSPTPAASADPEIKVSKSEVIIPPGRPDWVESEPDFTSDLHTIYVGSGPFVRVAEADRALDKALVEATNAYIVEQLGSPIAKNFVHYDARTIKRRFLQSDHIYHEVIGVSVGPMHQAHALLEFSPKFRAELEQRWAKVRGTSRLLQTGLFSGTALLFLASIVGYFRADNATRNSYSRRLQFLAALAILAIIGAGAMLAQWITWL